MTQISDYIERAAKRTGFKRHRYLEKNMPTQSSNIVTIPLFADMRSTFDLSLFLLNHYKKCNPDKYVILCSWPGWSDLFPFVDEYWTIDDESLLKKLALEAGNVYNYSNLATELGRSLTEVLNIITVSDIKKLFYNGFTAEYKNSLGGSTRFLPELSSFNRVPGNIKTQVEKNLGKMVVIHPVYKVRSWQNGKVSYLNLNRDFWHALTKHLIVHDLIPVVYQDWFTYDLSKDFNDQCIYLTSKNISEILTVIRQVGCVLDVHSGASRLALAARVPYLSVTERAVFVNDKDSELEYFGNDGIKRSYIYSFATMLMYGNEDDWKLSLMDHIIIKLRQLISEIDFNKLPTTQQSFSTISTEKIHERKQRRTGAIFLNKSKQL